MEDSTRKKILRNYYELDRDLTDEELKEEIQNLKRKHQNMTLDTFQHHLFCILQLDNE